MLNNKLKKIILLFGDIFFLYLSLYLALLLRYQGNVSSELWQIHLLPFSVIFAVWLAIFYIFNLYNLNIAISNIHFFKRLGESLLSGTVIAVIFFYLATNAIAPKTNLAIFIVIFAIIMLIWRQIYNWILASRLPKNNIAIIGLNQLAEEIISVFKNKPHLGMKIAFILDLSGKEKKELNGVPVFSNVNELQNLIEKKSISNIVLAADPNASGELRTALFDCLKHKINFLKLADFYESATGRVPLDAINKMWFLENLSEGDKITFDALKRFFDILLSLLAMLITWPLCLAAAIAIKLESSGPIFYTQTRCGKYGQRFKIIKFRTMRQDGDHHSPTVENDPRISKFGNLLRKTRIDEIPQIFNILLGEMSFIGPRPERPELIEELEKKVPFYRERMLVKPGVTGWDQVCGEYHSPSLEDTIKKLQYDLFYIKNRSLLLDFSIILKTVSTVLSRAGR